MPLQFNKTFKGAICNHWEILNIKLDFKKNRSIVFIALYKDQATRDANIEDYVDVIRYIWRDSRNPFTLAELNASNPEQIAEEKIKALTKGEVNPSLLEPKASELEWEGALDV